jgi:hypothetical protein
MPVTARSKRRPGRRVVSDMQLGFTSQEQQDHVERNQPFVEEKLDEPVLAWSLFYRTGGWGALAASHSSPLAASAIRLVGKKRDGGLPALCPRRHAFEDPRVCVQAEAIGSPHPRARRVGSRAIRVSCRETAPTMRLEIEAPADGERWPATRARQRSPTHPPARWASRPRLHDGSTRDAAAGSGGITPGSPSGWASSPPPSRWAPSSSRSSRGRWLHSRSALPSSRL